MRLDRMLTVARIDLRRLFRSKDYWIPMGFLAGVFFIALPFLLLTIVTSTTSSDLVNKIGEVLQSLPGPVQENVVGDTPAARGAYMLAVYLLAPVAIVVPLTISSAVGAHAIVGERERGTGEFLAESHRRGWTVRGVERDPRAAAFAIEKYKLRITSGTLFQVPAVDESFDVITMWHVLEHLYDLHQHIVRVRDLQSLAEAAVPRSCLPSTQLPALGTPPVPVRQPLGRLRRP